MQAAQRAANGGDRVVVRAGNYGPQTLSSRAKPTTVNYYAQSYTQPATAVAVLSARTDVNFASLTIDTNNVHVHGIQASSQGFVDGGETMDELQTLVIDHVTSNVLVDGWRGHAVGAYGSGITLSHMELGNANYCSSRVEERDALQFFASPANGDRLTYSVLHDWFDGSSRHDGACGQGDAGGHDDCVQSNGGTGQAVADDLFYKCGSSSVLQWGEFSGGHMGRIRIENNYFGDKPTEYNILSMGQGHCQGLIIRNNVFEAGKFDNNLGCIGTPTQDNNIMLAPVASCDDGGGFSGTHNIFVRSGGVTCGSRPKRCTPSFTYGRPAGYAFWQPALKSTDRCAARYAVSDYPATDFYGARRRSPAAAGASQPKSG